MRGKRTKFIQTITSLAFALSVTSALPSSPRGFQFELYGGLAQPGLSGWNRLVEYDNRIQAFNYDSLLDYLRRQGVIVSWVKNQNGGRKKIDLSFPLGMRLRYRLSRTLSVSLGARASLGRAGSDFTSSYTRRDASGYEDKESVKYSPYLLSARSLAVQAGVHFSKALSHRLTLEAHLAAGPVFSSVRYFSNWEYVWNQRGPGTNFDVLRMTGSLEEKGKGTGIAADLGARIQYPVLKKLGLFLEGVYAYQTVNKISGAGREIRGDVVTTWQGRWAVKKETIAAPWGTITSEFPTNYWPEGSSASRVRNFHFDSSGFQIRIGLAYTF